MNNGLIDLPHLHTLIGLRVLHQGVACTIVEVLNTPPGLVLQPDGPARLMPDQHGQPGEYGMATLTLSLLTDNRTGLSDDLLDLELLD
ncbi:MAG: hypothetical protein HZB71_10940 [Betaproteobacteria bacterium]|nr:hypothetical protein [Betaproteobacteria bacterium]